MSPAVKRPKRRPRGSLTRDEVVDAALRLADREGLGALSMPALARELDCGVMTIYGYVQDKEDLLDAIAQRGLADISLPRPLPRDQAGVLGAWGRALREMLLDHPSLAMIFLSRSVIGPGIFRGAEALLGALARAGMQPSAGVHAIYAVIIYTTGFVAWELPRTRWQSQDEYAASWRRGFAALNPDELPLAATVVEEFPRVAGDDQFELGLVALSSGLGATPRTRRRS
jgi:TetR/AcrR family transcriptional regulator, tetracycline repressor protein